MSKIIQPKRYKVSETKVSSEALTILPFSVIKYIEDQHEGGICAIGQYDDEYGSDSEKGLYTVFWTDHYKLNVYVSFNLSEESEEDVINRFNYLNNHLIPVETITSLVNDGFVRNRPTIRITYTLPHQPKTKNTF